MATLTKSRSRGSWWIWGGAVAAVIAVVALISAFDLFGFGAPASDPVLTEPLVEQPVPAPAD